MIKDTHNKKRGAYGAFVGLVFSALLIFGLYLAIPAKTARADNNYISDVVFYNDTANGNKATLRFYCKASFSFYPVNHDNNGIYHGCETNRGTEPGILKLNGDRTSLYGLEIRENGEFYDYISGYCGNTSFTAGNTYDIFLSPHLYTSGSSCEIYGCAFYYDVQYKQYQSFYYGLTASDYISDIFCNRSTAGACLNETFYLVEFPVLNISFPGENQEIADAFYIQGDYTIPDASNFDKFTAYIGRGVPYYQYSFTQELTEKNGLINLRISGLLAGDYYINFLFSGGGDNPYWTDFIIENISIVESIPPELPGTQEIPPDIFSTLSAQAIYLTYSNYATSTALFGAFSGAIEPLIMVIGDNLTFFSSQFNQDTAKDTGEKAGNAVLLIRSYAGNINSFFNDMPISEILFLYLSALVAVVVFRLIRLLIKLIPFI